MPVGFRVTYPHWLEISKLSTVGEDFIYIVKVCGSILFFIFLNILCLWMSWANRILGYLTTIISNWWEFHKELKVITEKLLYQLEFSKFQNENERKLNLFLNKYTQKLKPLFLTNQWNQSILPYLSRILHPSPAWVVYNALCVAHILTNCNVLLGGSCCNPLYPLNIVADKELL